MEIGIQWPLALFTVISGAGFGLLFTIGLGRLVTEQGKTVRQVSLVASFVLLCVGGLMSVFHLSHPERFMAAIANLLSFSGIALELLGLIAGCAVAAVFFLLSSAENAAGEKALAVLAVIVGLVAPFLQGLAYFEVKAQVGWSMLALPLSYLLTSLAAGAAIYLLLRALKGGEGDVDARQLIAKVTLALAVLAAVAVVAYVANLGMAGRLDAAAMPMAVLTAACAVAAAAVAGWLAARGATNAACIASVVLCVASSLLVRVLMWVVAEIDLNLIAEAAMNRGLYPF